MGSVSFKVLTGGVVRTGRFALQSSRVVAEFPFILVFSRKDANTQWIDFRLSQMPLVHFIPRTVVFPLEFQRGDVLDFVWGKN